MPATPETAMPRPTGLSAVPLADLVTLAGATVVAADTARTLISGVSLRSGAVRPGDLFAALPGSSTHGARFAASAVADGARAILTDPIGADSLRAQPGVGSAPILVVDDPRAALGALAARVYSDPSRRIRVIGVTGTSGKTTTCYLLEGALAATGERTGLIGTVELRIDGERLPASLTTPEAPDLQALLAVMVERGVTTVAMEVSSHALALGRVNGTRFAVGAFTNLSQEHLDFHGDMEHYFAAKRLLFDGRAAAEVVVVDDEYGRRLAAARPGAITVTGRAHDAVSRLARPDWSARTVARHDERQMLTIDGPAGRSLSAQIGLPGVFNVTNAVTALACVDAAGLDVVRAAAGLAAVRVPGRMERVDAGQSFSAFVDYAHKPAALADALIAAREQGDGRVIVVIGAGGDRDTTKRPEMGRVAAHHADVVIVTDDNPRSEDPATIRAQISAGIDPAACRASEIADRRDAIAAAAALAEAGDVLLVAGKGHEEGQQGAEGTRPFSDREQLRAALAERAGVVGRA